MKYSFLFLLLLLSTFSLNAETPPIWGQTGHRVVGAIADNYLKSSTKRKIKKLLNYESLALASTFADEIKSDTRYNKFKTWHYLNMPLDGSYESSEKNPEGDLVIGIAYCKEIITNDNSTDDDKAFYLKMLIHLIGDLHQPMHLGLREDRGGNDFKLQWNYKDTNMHRVWDTQMIESFGMSFSELADNATFLSKEEVKTIKEGTVVDWITETHILTNDIYKSAEQGENLRGRYSYKYLSIARSQMQKAGIRLATVLNDIL
ncbi:S1/P1 nuclease [Psychroserpens burtonensis]|uniref:S1/P1 nuclease n=1 Tax=Psychroserpens burtonensis TaxID=49278 RepID=A0A5C7B4V4_9FLAO|nr:S1/P1 nuclease [Psychroserpens burtonensis]TXE15458.1 S1/P1 nuclease [Psychroserpens burtonensis]